MYTARITVYWKSQELKPDLMTDDELEAIVECVEDLFRTYGSRMRFVPELDEDDLLLLCTEAGRPVAFPKEWITRPVRMANGKELRLFGDRIPVLDSMHLKFTDADDE
jgi:hypothetical protein